MKDTAIIYLRRSQDRDDRQQNTLETQLKNSFETKEKYGLNLLGEPISESKSAKTEFKRAGFERMILICKRGEVDYIIADDPKRLSRNNIDSSRIIDLMDKGLIKGVLVTGREYLTSNPRDKFLLQLDLSLSKMDNEERGIDVLKKMTTAIHRGQWMGKAIFGYRNVGTKGNKDVCVVEAELDLVRQAFIMRSQGKGLTDIAGYINSKVELKFTAERISKILKNTKYYGLQKFGGQEALLNSPGYKPAVSKELYDKANNIYQVRQYKKDDSLPRYFVGLLKDTEGNNLSPYEKKKKYIYYHNNSKGYAVNISQKKLFDLLEKQIENYNFPLPFVRLTKATLKEYYKDKVKNREVDLRQVSKELNNTQLVLDSIMEKYLSNEIDQDIYKEQKAKYEEKKIILEEKYNSLKQGDDNIITIIENLCELVENLSETYKKGDDEKKGKIIKAMQCELILTKQKELVIKENKLFESIRLLNFQYWYSHGELNSDLSLEKAAS